MLAADLLEPVPQLPERSARMRHAPPALVRAARIEHPHLVLRARPIDPDEPPELLLGHLTPPLPGHRGDRQPLCWRSQRNSLLGLNHGPPRRGAGPLPALHRACQFVALPARRPSRYA